MAARDSSEAAQRQGEGQMNQPAAAGDQAMRMEQPKHARTRPFAVIIWHLVGEARRMSSGGAFNGLESASFAIRSGNQIK